MRAASEVTLTVLQQRGCGEGGWIREGCRERKCNGVGWVFAGGEVVSGGRDVGSKGCSIISHYVVVGRDVFVDYLIQHRIILFFLFEKI